MKTITTRTIGMISTVTLIAIFASGLAVTGQLGKVYSQTNESSNMSAMGSNASSMAACVANESAREANITGSNANDTGMGAPHASNMTAEKVLAPNGTAPS